MTKITIPFSRELSTAACVSILTGQLTDQTMAELKAAELIHAYNGCWWYSLRGEATRETLRFSPWY